MRMLTSIFTLIALLFCNISSANSFKTEKWRTANGVQVIFYQAMEVPMLDINLAFAAGSAYDGNAYGVSALTAQLLNQGTSQRDATAVAETLANTGAQLNIENGRDLITVSLRTLTAAAPMEQAVTTFSDIVAHPDFTDEAFGREKKQQLMAIEQTQESPDQVAALNLFQTLYKTHPYAHAVNGTKESTSALTKQQVVEFYQRYYVGSNAILVMAGAIDSKTAHRLADKITQALPAGTPAPSIPKASPSDKAEQITIPFPSSQTIMRLGQVGIENNHPDYFPLMLGNYILGGGTLVSRLGVEVREKRGLTYGITSQFSTMPGKGPFVISFSTKNDQASNALDITQNTLKRFIQNGPNANELSAAKHYLTGSFPLSLASNRAIANFLLLMSFYQLPDNYLDNYVARINAVTQKDIQQAFKRQVHPDALVLIRVGTS